MKPPVIIASRGRNALAGAALGAVLAVLPPGAHGARLGPTEPKPLATTTIGIEGRVLYRWQGPALRPKPVSEKAAIVLRLASVTDDGPAKIYDLRYTAALPGYHNLKNYLERIDTGPTDDLPSAYVLAKELLPEDHDGELENYTGVKELSTGGYRTWLFIGGVAWVLPLGWVITRRLLRRPPPPPPLPPRPLTLEDQLRPLVERILAGQGTLDDQARLELLLLSYWRSRLNLLGAPHGEAVQALRRNEQAGLVLRQLEAWLHKPHAPVSGTGSVRADSTEVGAWLEPYRSVGAVNLDAAPAAGGAA